ncbi:hypothetical protein HZF10_15700 [Flavobacterium sp. MAH-1]|uniref:Lipoprotein n=2 Tax=Flavobacterium agri TaxID=2743471 RepID=A0A7Y8Y4B9_9FLAO|nr:hypothetical protein [Flavobacterium agri]
MTKSTIIIMFTSIIFYGCNSKSSDFSLTFYRWSIHEDYYLKLNNYDTILYIIDNPIEKMTRYALISEDDRELLQSKIQDFNFPKTERFSSQIDDGLSYNFVYESDKQIKRLSNHVNSGPKEFWELGKLLESLKAKYHFQEIKKDANLKEMNNFIFTNTSD